MKLCFLHNKILQTHNLQLLLINIKESFQFRLRQIILSQKYNISSFIINYKIMNERTRRLKSIELELMDIYEDLFGVKYIPGLQNTEKTEFNRIIEAFRERIYNVKALQQQRDKKQAKKGYKPSIQQIKINQDIRDDIKQCQNILQEAFKRIKVQVKDKSEDAVKKIMANRQATLKNCEQLLQDVLQSQQRGTYKPAQKHKTMDDLKRCTFVSILEKRMANQEEQEMIDIQDIKKFDKYRKKDQEIDDDLEEVINLNREIKNRMREANQKIDETDNKIKQNLLRGQKVDDKIQKATSRLKQVIKEYRRPNKLCLNITMFLLFLALIGVIINLIKNSS